MRDGVCPAMERWPVQGVFQYLATLTLMEEGWLTAVIETFTDLMKLTVFKLSAAEQVGPKFH